MAHGIATDSQTLRHSRRDGQIAQIHTMRLTPRCPVGNALNDLFCVPKQMGAEIPSAEQIGGYSRGPQTSAGHGL